MGWEDLLDAGDETTVSPWVGGRTLRTDSRVFKITGKLPREHGWYSFDLHGRSASVRESVDSQQLQEVVVGYLVGNRLVVDGARVDPDPQKIADQAEQVYLIEEGLDRFVRVAAGRPFEDGPLIYSHQEMPLGPEDDVLTAFLDEADTVAHIPDVAPALDAVFRMEVWRRAEAVKQRLELERQRREEEERLARIQKRQELVEQLGDGAGRRRMAVEDFDEAAKAALRVGGAHFLDSRNAHQRSEKVVRFRFDGRRFECTCDATTLRIIDAGICLQDHNTGVKGDTFFTLESFPAVIRQAIDEDKLVVWRHI